jgi:hypothetical protein
MTRSVEEAARLLDVLAAVDPSDSRTAHAAEHIPQTYTAFLQHNGLRGSRIGDFRQAFDLVDGADSRVVTLFEAALADLRAAGADLVDDVRVPGFHEFPRPPQTAATTKADWERFFAYEGTSFPIKRVAELGDAPQGKACAPASRRAYCRDCGPDAPKVDAETIRGVATSSATATPSRLPWNRPELMRSRCRSGPFQRCCCEIGGNRCWAE